MNYIRKRRVVAYLDHPIFPDAYELEYLDGGNWRLDHTLLDRADAEAQRDRHKGCDWVEHRGDGNGVLRGSRTKEELLALPVGLVFERDPRVMTGRPGEAMTRLPNGWMVGSWTALTRHVTEGM